MVSSQVNPNFDNHQIIFGHQHLN